MDDDLIEGTGENFPSSSFGGGMAGGGPGAYDLPNDVFNKLVEIGHEEAVRNPEALRELIDSHFNSLPPSYGLDVNLDRVEDVLVHQNLLASAKDPDKRPVFHVRFLENLSSRDDDNDENQAPSVLPTSNPSTDIDNERILPQQSSRSKDCEIDFEPCSKLEDLNLEVKYNSKSLESIYVEEIFPRRQEMSYVRVHEVVFSALDKPKLLSQLSALLSDIGLNIREAHVFSTTDGYSLDVFVVDGWEFEATDGLYEALENAIARSEGSWSGSGSAHSRLAAEKALKAPVELLDWEIDRRLLKLGKNIGSGTYGDLYHGVYHGQDVAVKVLKSENLNTKLKAEFVHEVAMLKQVLHENIVRFIGASTKAPDLCIVTEYMPGGSLYDYLHKNQTELSLHQLLKFAIDICRGMSYLHQNDIIHRDLKTANLLIDTHNVVKVADFGVARFSLGGVMTAETGTYRWMAPEVINHEHYNHKADIYSFAIVLWELITAKIPYATMTPIQAALGVRQGLRPDLPVNAQPELLNLMQRCWDSNPEKRPAFSEILIELEHLLEVQEASGDNLKVASDS